MQAPFFRLLGLGLLLGALSACAPITQVVLLPQDNGAPSAVVVRSKQGGEQVLSQSYQRASTSANDPTPTVDQVDPAKLQAQNKTLFEMRPPKPQRFVLYFVTGGTTLTPASVEELGRVLQAAKERLGADITVTGHTDTVGSTGRNDLLSRQRAQEIRQMIVDRGFPSDHIEAIGRGERELAVPTGDDVVEPLNRRVVIDVR